MGHIETVTIKAPPRRKLTEGEVREKHFKLSQQRTTVERLARELEAAVAALRQQARDDGHARLLRELDEPPGPTPSEPRARYRVVKPYRHVRVGPRGREEFSSDVNAIVDLPAEVARVLGDRVQPVDRATEIRGVPLKPGQVVD